jgi:hypothetical protein
MYGLAANPIFRPMPGLGTSAGLTPTGCFFGGTYPNCTTTASDIQTYCSNQGGTYNSQSNVCTISANPFPSGELQSLCAPEGGAYDSQANSCTITAGGAVTTYSGDTMTIASPTSPSPTGGQNNSTGSTSTGSVSITSNEVLLGVGIILAALVVLPLVFGNH